MVAREVRKRSASARSSSKNLAIYELRFCQLSLDISPMKIEIK